MNMKPEIQSDNPNYLAQVVQLGQSKSHPNADRLQIFTVNFSNVITDLTAKEDDIYVYFPLECMINKEFLSYINGFEDKTKNEDPEKKGFFNKHGRVRATSLRGIKSEGFIIPAERIEKFFGDDINLYSYVGQEFDTINDVRLCQKYVNPNQKTPNNSRKNRKNAKVESTLKEGQFRLHEDTLHLKKFVDRLDPSDAISISKKMHGTSVVLANVLCQRPLKWYEKPFTWFGFSFERDYYDYVFSSRRVIKNLNPNEKNHYYDSDVWTENGEKYKHLILPGITLYGEIVGYQSSGSPIQGNFDYGEELGSNSMYVYRITHTNSFGHVYEFSSDQITEYCQKYGLKRVPLYYNGYLGDLLNHENIKMDEWHEPFIEYLSNTYLEKDEMMSKNDVPDEGIVLRKESIFSFEAYKLKSFRFLELETKANDKGEENIEDEA